MDPEDIRVLLEGVESAATDCAEERGYSFAIREQAVEWMLATNRGHRYHPPYYEAYLRLKAAVGGE